MSEQELAVEINYSLQNLGAEKPAFDTISSFGKNTAEPHYSHGDTKLCKGDYILCDFGACLKNIIPISPGRLCTARQPSNKERCTRWS
jgi:Xaa-Pro aminopeptidase